MPFRTAGGGAGSPEGLRYGNFETHCKECPQVFLYWGTNTTSTQ
jgi:hypothetical protein